MQSITADISRANEWLHTLGTKQAKDVVRFTMSDLAKKSLAATKAAISDGYNVTKTKVPIKQRLAGDGISAILYGSSREASASMFNPVQTDTGVTYEIKRGDKQTKDHAFLATMPTTGFDGIFRRTGKKRLPIEAYHTVSFGSLLKSEWIHDIVSYTVASNADQTFYKKLASVTK